MNKTIWFAAWLCACIPLAVKSQGSTSDLSQLHIGLGYLPVTRFAPKQFDYVPTRFTRATFGVNCGKGYLRYNLQYTYISSNKPATHPDCRIIDNSLAYHYYIPLFNKLYLFGGGQVGLNTYNMNVKGTNLSPAHATETELSGGLEIGLEARFKNKLGVMASFKHQRIFATPRNDLSLLDVGLVYYFNSNPKLKAWLD